MNDTAASHTAGPDSELPPALPAELLSLDDPRVGRIAMYARGPAPTPQRPPVLLVHSVNAAASAYEMRPLFERLARSRRTYALDLPGYGLSERGDRPYSPRLMTDALHAAIETIQERESSVVDGLALSLACEFLARAAEERPEAFRTLALVSPTAFDRRGRRDGPRGSTLGSSLSYVLVACPLWAGALFRLLTRPGVVRYFLDRAWGRKGAADPGLVRYAARAADQPGARFAPLRFLSGYLFSGDISPIYEALEQPVWMSHGVRGDFTDYSRAEAMKARANWTVQVYSTGALPHFELPDAFARDYEAFLERHG